MQDGDRRVYVRIFGAINSILMCEQSPRQGRILTYRAIESGGNDFLVVFVAGIGFFTDSYMVSSCSLIRLTLLIMSSSLQTM
jgi:hypothetical protein